MKIKLSFLLCLTSMFLLSACGNGDENNSSLFSNYSSEVLETYCAVKGAVQTKNSDTDLVYIECSQNIDTSMEYSFTRIKGDIKIYYHSPDGTDYLLEDTSEEKGSLVDGTCDFSLERGLGKIYFTGTDSSFEFSITIHVHEENIRYFDAKSPQENCDKEQEYEEYEQQLEEKYGNGIRPDT